MQRSRYSLPTNAIPDFGKIPPQAIDIEAKLLGTCIMFPYLVPEVDLIPEMFYKNAHQKIFTAIVELSKKGLFDASMVVEWLRNQSQLEEVGGPLYILGLMDGVYTDQIFTKHALIINEKYRRREYIRVSSQIQSIAFDESVELGDIIEYTESSLFKISNITEGQSASHISKCIDDLIAEVEAIHKKEKSLVGVPSGFIHVDRATGGWQPGDLIIVAGRPSMGKTAMALVLALNPARMGYPVAMFSLEMSKMQLATRLMSGTTGYSSVDIRNANINFDHFVDGSHELASLPIIIDDTPALQLNELRSRIKKMVVRNGIRMVIVDYLQLMKNKAQSREQEISSISQGLKAISKEMNIPIIALSQLNREVESRANKFPILSDLRESGAIEQDADIVCFITRPEYYKIPTVNIDGADISTRGLIVFDGAKNRNGALFMRPLYHNKTMSIIREDSFEEDYSHETNPF